LCPGKWGAGGVAAIGGGLVIIGGKRGVGGDGSCSRSRLLSPWFGSCSA